MTIRDWLEVAGVGLVILSALGSVRVSMALRVRDRQDFELLRNSCRKTDELMGELRERVAKLEGAAE